MHLQILIGHDPQQERLVQPTAQLLAEAMAQSTAGIMLTNIGTKLGTAQLGTELIHFIGYPSARNITELHRAFTRFVGIIVTPLATLTPWYKPSRQRVKLMSDYHIVSSGSIEQQLLEQQGISTPIIANPIVSPDASQQQFADSYRSLYQAVAKATSERIEQHIVSTLAPYVGEHRALRHLLATMLRANIFAQRNTLYTHHLHSIATELKQADINEHRFAQIINQLGLTPFARQLMGTVQQHTGLAEGFLPLAPAEAANSVIVINTPPEAPANFADTFYTPPEAPANFADTFYTPPEAPANSADTFYTPPEAPANFADTFYTPPEVSAEFA